MSVYSGLGSLVTKISYAESLALQFMTMDGEKHGKYI